MLLTNNSFFWSVIRVLLTVKGYEMVTVSSDRTEVWLRQKDVVVRLKRDVMNGSNDIRNDLLRTYAALDGLKRRLRLKNVTFINTYMTSTSQVMDYEEIMEQTVTNEVKQLGDIRNVVISSEDMEQSLSQVQQYYSLSDEEMRLTSEWMMLEEEDIIRDLSLYLEKKQEKAREILEYGKPLMTYLFIGIQVVLFLLMELNGGSTNTQTLINFGAKYNPLIVQGEWWRFITPVFLHIGFLHLMMNTIALYYIGSQVEKIYGSVRFLFLYLFAGFTGVLLSFLLSDAVAAGASGAIFGCFGALLYVALVHKNVLSKEIITNVLTLIGINLVFGFAMPGIDNGGHIGGLIGGLLAAFALHVPNKKRPLVLNIGAIMLVLVATIGFAMYSFSVQQPKYETIFRVNDVQDALNKDDITGADKMLQSIFKSPNPPLEAYFFSGYVHLQKGEYNEAISQMKYVTQRKQDFHQAYYYLAVISLQEKKVDEAKSYIQEALKSDGNNDVYKKLEQQIDKQ